MHPDIHLVRTRPAILDVPPLVWIDPPGTPRVQVPSGPLWEWPDPPPRRRWRMAVPRHIALAVIAAVALFALLFTATVAWSPSSKPLALPVPGEPVWCTCLWLWPSGPATTLPG
jgi:hypothetical protein